MFVTGHSSRLVTDEATFDLLDIIEFGISQASFSHIPHSLNRIQQLSPVTRFTTQRLSALSVRHTGGDQRKNVVKFVEKDYITLILYYITSSLFCFGLFLFKYS